MPMDNASSMSLLDEMGTKSGTLGGGFQGFFQGICPVPTSATVVLLRELLSMQKVGLNGLWSPFGRRRDPERQRRMTSRELGCMLRVGTRSFAGAQDDRRAAGLDGWDGSEILR